MGDCFHHCFGLWGGIILPTMEIPLCPELWQSVEAKFADSCSFDCSNFQLPRPFRPRVYRRGIAINAPARRALHRLSGEGSGFIVKILDIGDIVVLRVLHPLDHRCDEVVIWGGEGGSVSYVVLVVEEDAELEGWALCLGDFGRDDGTSRFRPRHSDSERLQTSLAVLRDV